MQINNSSYNKTSAQTNAKKKSAFVRKRAQVKVGMQGANKCIQQVKVGMQGANKCIQHRYSCEPIKRTARKVNANWINLVVGFSNINRQWHDGNENVIATVSGRLNGHND